VRRREEEPRNPLLSHSRGCDTRRCLSRRVSLSHASSTVAPLRMCRKNAAAEIHSPLHSPGTQAPVVMRHSGRFGAVSKTVDGGNVVRGFESLPLRLKASDRAEAGVLVPRPARVNGCPLPGRTSVRDRQTGAGAGRFGSYVSPTGRPHGGVSWMPARSLRLVALLRQPILRASRGARPARARTARAEERACRGPLTWPFRP
jgi:hypothetical protein